jgi:hypothetical protein
VVFPSTVNLWKSLQRTHGLQPPRFAGLEEQVLVTFERMYATLEATRGMIAPSRFYELRYEELVADPVGQLRGLYEHLRLGGFDEALPHVQRYLAGVSGYETNRYELTEAQRAAIAQRWGAVIQRYGYSEQ